MAALVGRRPVPGAVHRSALQVLVRVRVRVRARAGVRVRVEVRVKVRVRVRVGVRVRANLAPRDEAVGHDGVGGRGVDCRPACLGL